MPEIPKTYDPKAHEIVTYSRWEKSGFFNPDKLPGKKKKKPFVISMPPSNITGELHLGHALGFTIQDIMVRYHRMRGEAALWLPGTDHAAIATQVVVERELRQQGIERQAIGRNRFLKHVWAWKEKYGSRITRQTKKLGASADWSRERFTMDEKMTLAVNTAFKRLYDDGLIYRGERIINWCSGCQTAISDIEVDHEDVPGKLWYLKYPLSEGGGHIVVATTRPETMLGDTAVAVHPDDPRYASMIGQTVVLPLVGRHIPIITDQRIDRQFGTGAVKVTPAHDPLDFDIGQDHHLPLIAVIGQDDRMAEAAGQPYAGLSVDDARRKIVDDLRSAHSIEKEEDYIHAVGFCSRSKTRIEPLVSLQWFLKTKPMAKKAIAAVRSGKIVILPRRFEKTYFHWMENIRDWNISRQIWWGHRLPVWYQSGVGGKELMKVSVTNPGPGWKQDEDTLDTWFSSGLWTFSTLGWPGKTADLARFHPTSVIETAWDILFFWVARMVMFSEYFLHEVPFRTVYIHGLILDAEGKKMSRSKGNGIDPMVISDKFGTDALRLSLIVGNAVGQDLRYSEQRAEYYRNFVNKTWNVARYVFSHQPSEKKLSVESVADAWILDRLAAAVADVTKYIEGYDFSGAGTVLTQFIWHDFADWYIEASKVHKNVGVLYAVLEASLKLLHPYAPFVTEALWQELHPGELLMVEPWPTADRRWRHPKEAATFSRLQGVVVALRNFRAHAGPQADVRGKYVDRNTHKLDPELLSALTRTRVALEDRLDVLGGYQHIFLGSVEFEFPEDQVRAYESWRAAERESLEQYIANIRRRLANEQFVSRAPAAVVEEERQKLAAAEQRLLEL